MSATATVTDEQRRRRRRRPEQMAERPPRHQWAFIVLLSLLAVFTAAPFLVMLVLALSPAGVASIPQVWPETLTLENLTRVFSAHGVVRWALNSAIYSVVSVVIILLTASMAGYAFAKKRFPGRDALLWAFLATLMVPFQALLIPTFVLVNQLEGVNTFWGLIVPTLANSQAVFLMRQFIRELPDELFEAAKIDGASEWWIYWRLVLPLTKPILATLGVFVFLWHWNDFLWPLVVGQSDSMRTLTVGLATLHGENVTTAELMAAATVSVVPCLVVFWLLQRYLVTSITMSGLKG